MKLLVLLILFCAAQSAPFFGTGQSTLFQCPESFVKLSTGCYHFSGSRVSNWFGAVADCHRKGAYLVTIDDSKENEVVGSYILQHEPANHWLGASDLGHESEWVWENTGLPVTYFNWFVMQPDNYKKSEHCLHFKRPSSTTFDAFYWNDMDCAKSYSYVCEADPTPVVPVSEAVFGEEILEAVATANGKKWKIVGSIRMQPIGEDNPVTEEPDSSVDEDYSE